MMAIALPFFNTLTEKGMTLQLGNPVFWSSMIAFTLFTGLLAGSYPAFYLSSFNPVRVLKGNLKAGKSGLISTDFSDDLRKNYEPFRQELLSSGAVLSICKSNSPPSQIYSNNNGWEWKNSQPVDKTVVFSTVATDYDYTKTLGIKLLDGRDFSRDFADSNAVILNQAAVKRMGLKNPVGEQLKWNDKPKIVVGIIPDIQMESPFRPISPLTIIFDKDWSGFLNIRINPNMAVSKALSIIKPVFDKYNPAFPFEYKFADEEYARKFNYEELVGNLAAIIASLAIFISCLGLFGLASFTAEQRVKEIGVRKVLGASVFELWRLLSKDFIFLVLIACLIAIPLAWYSMHEWLAQYEYKVNIGVAVFVLVTIASIIITLLTVSYQAIKAALMNPVKSLRSE